MSIVTRIWIKTNDQWRNPQQLPWFQLRNLRKCTRRRWRLSRRRCWRISGATGFTSPKKRSGRVKRDPAERWACSRELYSTYRTVFPMLNFDNSGFARIASVHRSKFHVGRTSCVCSLRLAYGNVFFSSNFTMGEVGFYFVKKNSKDAKSCAELNTKTRSEQILRASARFWIYGYAN